MSDYRVKITIRNARILRAIESMGERSVAAWCRRWGLSSNQVNALICNRRSPMNKSGRLCAEAQALCEALGALPEDLFTEEQLWGKWGRATYEAEVSTEQMQALRAPREFETRLLDRDQIDKLLPKADLNDNEKIVLAGRFFSPSGEDVGLNRLGEILCLSPERIRQIESKALRKMRRAVYLLDHSPEP